MPEQRASRREQMVGPGVSSFTERPDGVVLEGAVKDIGDNGARIVGAATGLSVGDEIRVVFVVQFDQKVRYRGAIKHIDKAAGFYGIEFRSGPEQIAAVDRAVKRCTFCKRKYTPEWNYCGNCGRELRFDDVPVSTSAAR